ncbi:MAG: prolyl oligopeptidase family serine peptidase [Phenylobacterium sp.]|uniref:S9 family peptidase n=1 Tax=Phenylobacterium sp. TaxID=1871053 RepID=UPI0025ED2390|nr:prolyl oligopeptidase family serine peptidase [Phenylobacterium sp.]MBI1198530.1 prolyl oligopeptidase family serine peptidase [Phenylobacterium sp.]
MPPRSPRLGARAAGVLVGVLALAGSLAEARGLQPADFLRQEGFGRIDVTPDGRWALVERRGPRASASRFDYDRFTPILRTRLQVADLARPGPLRDLVPAEPGVGYALGPAAPDGTRVAVMRLKADVWELGVATPGQGVRWLGITPDIVERGRSVAWLSPTTLAVLAPPAGLGPHALRAVRAQAGLAALHAAAARGEAAVTVLGSGAYLGASRDDPPSTLLAVDSVTGARRPLATGEFTDLEASPDGRRIALLEAGAPIVTRSGRPVHGVQGTELRRARLRLVDVAQARVTAPCPGWDMLGQLLRWSPDGRSLLVYARADDTAWTKGALRRVEAATGACPAVTARGFQPLAEGRPMTVRAGWLGDEVVAYGRIAGAPAWRRLAHGEAEPLAPGTPPLPRDGLLSDGAQVMALAGGRFWRIRADRAEPIGPAGLGEADRLTAGFTPRFARGVASLDALIARGRAADGGDTAVALRRDGSIGVWRLPGRARVAGVSNARHGLVARQVLGGGRQRLLWLPRRGAPVTLADLNPGMEPIEPPRVVAVRHAGPRGEPLTSWVLLPAADPASPPPPLVVWPYPGSVFPKLPDSVDVPAGGEVEEPAMLVGHGYAVLIPSLPTLAGRGPAEGLAARLLGIVDAAAATPALRGAFDARRVGLWGASFGGYAVLAAAEQTDRFGAGVARASIADLFSRHGDTYAAQLVWPRGAVGFPWAAGWTEDLQGGMGAPPWAAPGRYLANSPALQADRIRTPLMIVHGDLDSIPMAQSAEMFAALFRQAKDAVFVVYFGEGHGLLSPGNLSDYYRRAFGFLDEHLGFSDPAPAGPASGPASDGPRTR